MEKLKNKYINLCNTPSDINEHLPTLLKYASECNSVLELGVRGCVSSYAFVNGLLNNNNNITKRFIMNDLNPCNINELLNYCNELPENLKLNVQWAWMNDLDLNLDTNVDLTFIDTWHIYGHLKRELEKFSKITNKYIIMHDTTLDAIYGETIRCKWNPVDQSKLTGIPVHEITKGLQPAIEEFLINNTDWKIKEIFINNNGLTILHKI